MAKCTRRTCRAFARIGSGTSLCLRYRLPQAAERLPGAQLTRKANPRLKVLDYARTQSVSAACRHFGIARSTFYRLRPPERRGAEGRLLSGRPTSARWRSSINDRRSGV